MGKRLLNGSTFSTSAPCSQVSRSVDWVSSLVSEYVDRVSSLASVRVDRVGSPVSARVDRVASLVSARVDRVTSLIGTSYRSYLLQLNGSTFGVNVPCSQVSKCVDRVSRLVSVHL